MISPSYNNPSIYSVPLCKQVSLCNNNPSASPAPLCKGSRRAATEGLSVPARLTFFKRFRQPRHDPFLSQSFRKKPTCRTSQPLRQNQRFRHRPLTGEAFNPKPNAHRHRMRFKSQNPAKNNPAESRAFCGVSFGKIRSQNVFPRVIKFSRRLPYLTASKAASRAAIRSSASSMPMDRRMVLGLMPCSASSASFS